MRVSTTSHDKPIHHCQIRLNKTQSTIVTKKVFGLGESDHLHSLLMPACYRNRKRQIFDCKIVAIASQQNFAIFFKGFTTQTICSLSAKSSKICIYAICMPDAITINVTIKKVFRNAIFRISSKLLINSLAIGYFPTEVLLGMVAPGAGLRGVTLFGSKIGEDKKRSLP